MSIISTLTEPEAAVWEQSSGINEDSKELNTPNKWFLIRSDQIKEVDMLGNTSVSWYTNMVFRCTAYELHVFISTGNNLIKILLLLPLSSFVLYHGHQKWRQKRSLKAASHSDVFSYHLAAMELFWVFGCFFFIAGLYTNHALILTVGMYFCYIPFYGELIFNLLTCVDRYLAVVHPLTYRRLKSYRGIRIRNFSIGCAWLLCFGFATTLTNILSHLSAIIVFCFFVLSIPVITFCSVSVLCILIRPGPRERGGDRDRMDHSRRRAFCTITVISSVVWLWFVGLLACHSLNRSALVSQRVECLVMAGINWLGLPCSLVSLLLYLHKARRL